MANICKTQIATMGLQEAPESFLKELSLSMFGIDLDHPDLAMWGDENSGINRHNWYSALVEEYRNHGCYAVRDGILYPEEPYKRLGVTVPRYYLETRSGPPVEELCNASKTSPDLIFHLRWSVMLDGPSGECVIQNGEVMEHIRRQTSWYLFDDLRHPISGLLPAHMNFTLAQHALLRFEDAIQPLEDIRRILADSRFRDSAYHKIRDGNKLPNCTKILDQLVTQMRDIGKELDFGGVFLSDSECRGALVPPDDEWLEPEEEEAAEPV